MQQKNIDYQRSLTVVKSNEMIRQGRFDLSLVEQRIVLYIVSKIKPGDTEFRTVSMSIREFCAVTGIEYQQNLSQLKDNIKALADKSIWFQRPGTKTKTLIRWIEKPELEEDTDTVRIRLDSDLMPYLLQLKSNFTEYELLNILALRSKYSVRLYELLKSYLHIGHYEITIEQLRDYLRITDGYEETKYFNRDVVAPAVSEINEYTDIEIEYQYMKKGRNITGYRFTMTEQAENVNVLARAYLSGKRPSKHRRKTELKEAFEQLQQQIEMEQLQIDMD